jgi:hypothetical protein
MAGQRGHGYRTHVRVESTSSPLPPSKPAEISGPKDAIDALAAIYAY